MKKLILGDNPFFGISHLSSTKSKKYLAEESLLSSATEVIHKAASLNIDTFMISSHPETISLLKRSGYFDQNAKLPYLAPVIPNVHTLNEDSASNGLVKTFITIATKSIIYFSKNIFSGLIFKTGIISGLLSAWIQTNIENYPLKKIKYICVHNVFVDLLLGLKCYWLLNKIAKGIKGIGYKPVFITLNPIQLDEHISNDVIFCFYYNLNGYNLVPDRETIQKFIKNTGRKCWLMGILASGTISPAEAFRDNTILNSDGILYATINTERLQEAYKDFYLSDT